MNYRLLVGLCCSVFFGFFSAVAQGTVFQPGDTLEQIEAQIAAQGYAFTVSPTWVYRMPQGEKQRFFSRRYPVGPEKRAADAGDVGPLKGYLKDVPLESAFSWTNYEGRSYIGPVRNQGGCGSCYSFGACAAAEGTYNVAMGLYDAACIDFSESFIAWCLPEVEVYAAHFGGCDGADYDYFELEALTQEGVCLESAFPYVESSPGACTHWEDPRISFQSWHRIPVGDVDAIKTAIRHFGVVDAAVLATSAFEAYSGGVYEDDNVNCVDGFYAETNHAIALVGWDDNPPEGGGGCWILRNSWGDSWGEGGYMRIRYHSAAVSCAATYLVYDSSTALPSVTTLPATDVTANSTVLHGEINAGGGAVRYWFEYGTSTAYGATTPEQVLAAPTETVFSVEATLTGLTEGANYHFRLAAANDNGTQYGVDLSLYEPATEGEGEGSSEGEGEGEGEGESFTCLGNVVADADFESGGEAGAWTVGSLVYGTPLWEDENWVCYFSPDYDFEMEERAYIEQQVVIPDDAHMLSFFLEVWEGSGNGYLRVLIDGNVLYELGDVLAYASETVTRDISAYADDASHTLRFEAYFAAGDMQEYIVDNVCIASAPVVAEPYHSADQNQDSRISVSELLRVIQFYNSSAFGCQSGTEDGYALDTAQQDCTPHDSDYNPQDWKVNLSELLRLIQFFNMANYQQCEETSEDGFCVAS